MNLSPWVPAGGRPEAQLLLWCAGDSGSPETTDRIRTLIREGIDWTYLLQAAHEHAMLPLLYRCLSVTCSEAVPKAALNRLRDDFHESTRRNLFLTGELLKILRVFEEQGIPAIPFKGPTLAALAYGNITLRQFGDLDILVHKQDISRAKELLVSLTYQQQRSLTGAQEAAFLHTGGEYVFERSDGKSMVELHWAIAKRHYSFRLDPKNLWERLEPISLGSDAVPTLSPEDLLLILCVHGCKHFWERLGWICDVASLVHSHEGMEWERLVERAGTQGSERMLYLGLFLANDLLGAALPEKVLQKVRNDPAVEALAEEARERLFGETNGQGKAFGDTRFRAFHLRMRERLRDRIRYAVRVALTPHEEDWMSLQLPALLWPLYYVLHTSRLIGKHGRRLLVRSL